MVFYVSFRKGYFGTCSIWYVGENFTRSQITIWNIRYRVTYARHKKKKTSVEKTAVKPILVPWDIYEIRRINFYAQNRLYFAGTTRSPNKNPYFANTSRKKNLTDMIIEYAGRKMAAWWKKMALTGTRKRMGRGRQPNVPSRVLMKLHI